MTAEDIAQSNRAASEKAERHIISYTELKPELVDKYIRYNQQEKEDLQANLANQNIELPPTTTITQLIEEGAIQFYAPNNKQDLYISIDKSTLEMTLCQEVSQTDQSFILYGDQTTIRTDFLYLILLELIQCLKTGKCTHEQFAEIPIVLMPIEKQEEFIKYSKNLTNNITQQSTGGSHVQTHKTTTELFKRNY